MVRRSLRGKRIRLQHSPLFFDHIFLPRSFWGLCVLCGDSLVPLYFVSQDLSVHFHPPCPPSSDFGVPVPVPEYRVPSRAGAGVLTTPYSPSWIAADPARIGSETGKTRHLAPPSPSAIIGPVSEDPNQTSVPRAGSSVGQLPTRERPASVDAYQ